MSIIYADWPAPSNIIAGTTTSLGGVSQSCYATNNLALHVGDDPSAVLKNRELLARRLRETHQLDVPLTQWQWLNQTHSVKAVEALSSLSGGVQSEVPEADACYSFEANKVCSVLTADCLPVLITDTTGHQIAAIHAGWRGLYGGIIESTVAALQEHNDAPTLMAWLGPAIGPAQFEVGDEVFQAFTGKKDIGPLSAEAFVAQGHGKYLANIYQLARIRLMAVGVYDIYGGVYCTVTDDDRFYSYRRQANTGRMASFIVRQS